MFNFEYQNGTRIFFGKGEISRLGHEIAKLGKKILIVYGKGSIKGNGIFTAAITEVEKSGVKWIEFGGVEPNPRIKTVLKGVEICRENGIEAVLAIGGGSTIDCAKAIAVGAVDNGNLWEIWEYKRNPINALPIAVVLTLAATGSEMNDGSVISNEEKQLKNGYGHPLMLPKFSILDPEYTFSVSRYQTACGVVDIMAHVFEFYFNQVKSGYLQARMSEAILKTCIRYGKIAVDNPDNYEARANIMWAGALALNGIVGRGVTFEGFNHVVEHAISAIYDLTHGAGLSILITHWMEYILDETTVARLSEYGRNVWEIENGDDYETAKLAICKTKEFFKSMGMPLYFSETEIVTLDIELVLSKVGTPIGAFKNLEKSDIQRILQNGMSPTKTN